MLQVMKTIFLTFDLDWARDDVIEATLDIIEKEDVKATIFVTHHTPLLQRMRKNKNIELGAHPNFIPLGNLGQEKLEYLDWAKEKIIAYKNLIPEATSIRSHMLTQNSRLLDLMKQMGYIRESNLLLPLSSGMSLLPFRHWNGLIRVPYFWEDDIYCTEMENKLYTEWNIYPFVYSNNIKIFNFHPIHVFLNTEKLDRYERARPYFKDGDEIYDLVNHEKYGDKNFLIDLIRFGKQNGYGFKRIDEIEVE